LAAESEVAQSGEERQVFRCQCGQYQYLDVYWVDWDIEGKNLYVAITEEPASFWERLKFLFKRQAYSRDIELSVSQAQRLAGLLDEVWSDALVLEGTLDWAEEGPRIDGAYLETEITRRFPDEKDDSGKRYRFIIKRIE
jgi:hypothetical protein